MSHFFRSLFLFLSFFALVTIAEAAPTYVNKPGALPSPCYMTPPAPGPVPAPTPTPTPPSPPNTTAWIEAESFTAMSGVLLMGLDGNLGGTSAVGALDGGDWLRYSAVNFGTTAKTNIEMRVAVIPSTAGGAIDIRIDGLAGPLLGTLTVQSTGGWGTFVSQIKAITATAGVHDVYLVFRGGVGIANIDNFRFTGVGGTTPTPSPTPTPTPGTPPPTTPPPSTTNPYSPYIWLQAENYQTMQGVVRSTDITDLDTTDWTRYTAVNFGSQGARGFIAHLGVPQAQAGGIIEVRLDNLGNTPVARLQTVSSGSWGTYTYQAISTTGLITGIHDVYVTFQGQEVAALNAFGFVRTTPTPQNPTAPPLTTVTLTNLPPVSTTQTTASIGYTKVPPTAVDTVYCRVDTNAPAICPSPFTLSSLAVGAHKVDYYLDDGYGYNPASPRVSYTWTIYVQPTPPPAPGPTPTPGGSPLPAPPSPYPTPTTITFYVDANSGSDSNDGRSPQTAWRSLNAVNSRSFSPGDVIGFNRGTSYYGGLRISSSGSASQPIFFTAYGSGAAPVFSNAPTGYTSSVYLDGNYVVVENFKMIDAMEAGIKVSGTHNIVRKNEMTNVGIGALAMGKFNYFEGNFVHDGKLVVNTPGGDDDYGANGFSVSSSDNEFAFNKCQNCRAPSYDYGSDGGMFELWGTNGIDNTYIHHNIAIDTNGFFETGGDPGSSARNVRIAYNEIINSGFGGIHAGGTFGIAVSNMLVENNTVVDSYAGGTLFWVYAGTVAPSAVTFRNNIIQTPASNVFPSDFTRSNNIYNIPSSSAIVGGSRALGAGEKIADPLFVNGGAFDFHLQASSPAIDAGANLGYMYDLDNKTLVGIPDAGAFEK